MARGSLLGAALGLAVGCGGAATQAPGADLKSAAAASPDGSRVFARECAGCHGKQGEGHGGTPRVIGAGAVPLHGHDGATGPFGTAADLFSYVKGNMPLPRGRVGSLSDTDYWAVVSYLVAANGKALPSGGLTAANAAGVVVNAN